MGKQIDKMRKSDIMVQISYKEGALNYSDLKLMNKKQLIKYYHSITDY